MIEAARRMSLRYGAAALAFGLAVAAMQIPIVARGPGNPALVIFFAIQAAAWYGGLGPGLTVTALVALATWPPERSAASLVQHALFVAAGAAISLLVESLHAARRQAEADALRERDHLDDLGRSEARLRLLIDSVRDYAIFTTSGTPGPSASWATPGRRPSAAMSRCSSRTMTAAPGCP